MRRWRLQLYLYRVRLLLYRFHGLVTPTQRDTLGVLGLPCLLAFRVPPSHGHVNANTFVPLVQRDNARSNASDTLAV